MAEHSANLQHLIQTNLDHLWCRGCVVTPEYLPLSDDAAGLAWHIDGGLLQLRGSGFAAGFADGEGSAPDPGIESNSDPYPLEEIQAAAGMTTSHMTTGGSTEVAAGESPAGPS